MYLPDLVYGYLLEKRASVPELEDVVLLLKQHFLDISDAEIHSALQRYDANLAKVYPGNFGGGVVIPPEIEPGPLPVNDEHWERVVGNLRRQGRDDQVKSLGEISAYLGSILLPPLWAPSEGQSPRKGLVLGSVQSGKTTNFIATMARAFDLGYKFVIVLSGTTNILRAQTQSAIDALLAVSGNEPSPYVRLTGERDFAWTRRPDEVWADLATDNKKYYAVVKKNSTVLQSLIRWIRDRPGAGPTAGEVPIFIIDDEADQASVQGGPAYRNKIAAINAKLRTLVSGSTSSRITFVGYTATPFANLLLDPNDVDDFFPRHFVVTIPPGPGYFGAAQLFGREPMNADDEEKPGLDIVREIPASDRVQLGRAVNPGSPNPAECPESLHSAIVWFLIATALKQLRGNSPEKWSSMLVNTSARIASHGELKACIESELQLIRQDAETDFRKILTPEMLIEIGKCEEILEVLELGSDRVSEIAHASLELAFIDVIGSVRIVVDNSKSTERLNYEDEQPGPIIAIGGSTLSRGIVLRGLISTYFLRTANGYDSLFQMGRWFGYRQGYEDLQRIWMEKDVANRFKFLALVDHEIRTQISEITPESGRTPLEIPPLIRADSRMQIVARGHNGVVHRVGFSDSRQETTLVDYRSPEKASDNLNAVAKLALEISAAVPQENATVGRTRVFRNVAWAHIKSFLHRYQFPSDVKPTQGTKLIDYVENVQSLSSGLSNVVELQNWDIYFYARSTAHSEDFEIISGLKVSTLKRAREESPVSGIGYFKHISGSKDFASTFPDEFRQTMIEYLNSIQGAPKLNDWDKLRRAAGINDRGVIGIYFIDNLYEDSLGNVVDEPKVFSAFSITLPRSDFQRDAGTYYGPPALNPSADELDDEDDDFDSEETE